MTDYDGKYREIGNRLIMQYQKEGTVPAGVNGPYDDKESIVRNLSHLIIMTAIEIRTFGRKELAGDLERMGAHLLSLRQPSGLYILRENTQKDACNGVIGHAWVVESLVYLYELTGKDRYLEAAGDIVSRHCFDKKQRLWHRPDYGGQAKAGTSIDYTLNHQLWFAASLAELNRTAGKHDYDSELGAFLDGLKRTMAIHKNGLICHTIYLSRDFRHSVKGLIKYGADQFYRMLKRPSYEYREQGYHVFNLMAVARLKEAVGEHAFFHSEKAGNIAGYVSQAAFLEGLSRSDWTSDPTLSYTNITEEEKCVNVYGYPYNVPGLELPYISLVLKPLIEEEAVRRCFLEQHARTFDEKRREMGKISHDKTVINYRVYEYYRYLEKKGRAQGH